MRRQTIAFIASTALLAATLVTARIDAARPPRALAAPLESIAIDINGWVGGRSETLPPDEIRLLAADQYLLRTYQRRREWLNLVVVHYAKQGAGVGPHAPEVCLSGNWAVTPVQRVRMALNGRSHDVNKFFIRNGRLDAWLY
jgi:uncharacterized protein DUF3485